MIRYLLPAAPFAWLALGVPAVSAQILPPEPSPRRQFVTISVDGIRTVPLHFGKYPLEQLTGKKLSASRNDDSDYHSDDGTTFVRVSEFRRRNRGAGITIYPLGAGNGPSLAIRGSFEELPAIHLIIDGPSGRERYHLADGRAYDLGIGVMMSDRSAGWGLGSHAFVMGGIGRIRSELGRGERYFAEGGGGLNIGPFGVQLSVKFARNRLDLPRPHTIIMVPMSLRGTLSF